MDNIELTMNDIELIDEIVRRADEHQKQKEKEFAIAELELVKEKITMKSRPQWERLVVNLTDCEIIINDMIAELKGENNE